MKKVKRKKSLREASYNLGRGVVEKEIIPPQKVPIWVRAKAKEFAKRYGVSAEQYLQGIRSGEYEIPENPYKATSGGPPMPNIPGLTPEEPPGCPPCTIERARELETKKAASVVRGAAAPPPMRPRLSGGKPQEEPSPLSQVPSDIPAELKAFALEFKDITDKTKLANVMKTLAKDSDKFGGLALVNPELLDKKIDGKPIDMDFIADLVLGDEKAIESLFKTIVIPAKNARLFNSMVSLIGVGKIKKFFSSDEEYKSFLKTLNENKGYIKLADILF
jgi:hypothetical protein